jgi:mRNA interferase MazF
MTRGEIWWCDFGIPFGSETGYKRPVLIIQDNDFIKSNFRTVLVLPITTNLSLGNAPENVVLTKEHSGLSKDSVVVTSQLTHIDKQRLEERHSKIIHKDTIQEIEDGLLLILGISPNF